MKETSLSEKMVYVESFTFGKKSKKYPYPMCREIDIKLHLKRLKERIKKYYDKDTNVLHMSFDLFCLELNGEFGKELVE